MKCALLKEMMNTLTCDRGVIQIVKVEAVST